MSDSGFPPPPPPPPLPNVPSAGRVPPPWEQAGPAVQRFIDTAKSVLMESALFFRRTIREGGIGAPLTFAVIGIAIGSIGSWATRMMTPFGGFGDTGGFFFSLIMLPILSVVGLFVGSAIFHVLFLLVAGSRQPFETTFRLLAYAAGSTSPFNVVPFLGGLIGGVWCLLVLILGGAEAHEVPQAKAAIVILLPAVICCGLAVLFGSALLALIAAIGLRS